MAFIGNQPTAVPLTSSQLADGLITTDKLAASAVTSAKILDSTIVNADIASTTINLTQKVTGTLPIANGGTALTTLGTAGQALVVNSTATALEFATVGATAGQVIQVLSATDDNSRTTSSASFVTASNTLSVSITPSSASNKIFIIVSLPGFRNDGNGAAGYATVYRGATNLGTANGGLASEFLAMDGSVQSPQYAQNINFSVLDSPSTTSAITYQVYMKTSGAGITQFNSTLMNAARATITLMEVKG